MIEPRDARHEVLLDDLQTMILMEMTFKNCTGAISICHNDHAFYHARLLGTLGLGILGRDLDPFDSCRCTYNFTCGFCLRAATWRDTRCK